MFTASDRMQADRRIDKVRDNREAIVSSLTAADAETILGPLLDPDRMSASRTEHLISGAIGPR